jgi:chaperonin GroES
MAKKARTAVKKAASKKSQKKSASPSKSVGTKPRANMLPLSPLGDKVVVRPLADHESGVASASGIIIPATVSEKVDRGTVVAVGPGRFNEDGDGRVPMTVAVGDRVIFQWGDKIEFGGTEYYLVSESNISAILSE